MLSLNIIFINFVNIYKSFVQVMHLFCCFWRNRVVWINFVYTFCDDLIHFVEVFSVKDNKWQELIFLYCHTSHIMSVHIQECNLTKHKRIFWSQRFSACSLWVNDLINLIIRGTRKRETDKCFTALCSEESKGRCGWFRNEIRTPPLIC